MLSHIRHRIYNKIGCEPFTIPPGPTSNMLIGAPPFAGEACRIYEGSIPAISLYVSWVHMPAWNNQDRPFRPCPLCSLMGFESDHYPLNWKCGVKNSVPWKLSFFYIFLFQFLKYYDIREIYLYNQIVVG